MIGAYTTSALPERRRIALLSLVLLSLLVLGAEAPLAAQPTATLSDTEILRAATAAGATAIELADVRAVYLARANTWAWTDGSGAVTSVAQQALQRFRDAASHGLNSSAYLLPSIAPEGDRDGSGRARGDRDVALTVATLRYMRHLHLGRVDPRSLGLRLQTWVEPHDFAQLLAAALARADVGATLDGLAPPWPLYGQLREARRQYRALTDAAWTGRLAIAPPVHPGDPLPAATALSARLAALGDLTPTESGAPSSVYGPALVAAVERFQGRHGLVADGVIGARTVSALAVPPSARITQIDIALERLRWLPDLGARRVIAVNIPMFRLWAWGLDPTPSTPAFGMDVIVGRAMRTETPVFVEALDHVIFRPYWNVPSSIVHGEVLPAIARDPRYLARQQMEIVRGPGDDATVVPPTSAAIAQLAAGTLRLRQRPGPHNSLGLVKFVFPNRENVYMHGTPASGLFAQSRRDFSHGCIRVADPPRLAAWVLQEVSGWTPAHIAQAMNADVPERVDLREPIDVVLFYLTAAVVPDDGLLHFAEDIYGHDARLAAALTRR